MNAAKPGLILRIKAYTRHIKRKIRNMASGKRIAEGLDHKEKKFLTKPNG
jgi:hypothetical protein